MTPLRQRMIEDAPAQVFIAYDGQPMRQFVHDVRPEAAIGRLPGGAWAVAVSGGADSVALLHLLLGRRADLSLHIVHLDHETRAGESTLDAAFVGALAETNGLPGTIATRSQIEPAIVDPPRNRSALFRACRLELFRRVVAAHALAGVVLAHHADDQAETIVQRLLRGSGPAGLGGMSEITHIGGITIARPLLSVRRAALRRCLAERGLAWREDAGNRSPQQQRNRVRAILERQEQIVSAALKVGEACRGLCSWLREAGGDVQGDVQAPVMPLAALRRLPPPVARDLARRWLADRAGPGIEIPPDAADRLLLMATDAASPSRQHFPGRLLVRRRAGKLSIDPSPVRYAPGRSAPH